MRVDRIRPLNAAIRHIDMPSRMKRLPLTDTGYPVPWFAEWVRQEDGSLKPELRATSKFQVLKAVRDNLCWICGDRLNVRKAFCIGPMCTVNRLSSEPPSHRECAYYAVRACPFLTRPRMRRNDTGEDYREMRTQPPGMLEHNPGVIAIWVTKSFELLDNRLIALGEPIVVGWYREGRPATREEALAGRNIGLPILERMAAEEGPESQAHLAQRLAEADAFLPTA